MLRGTARVLAATAVALCLGCGGLAHPLSDDGNDKGNPTGSNPGSQTLTATLGKSTLTVGDTTSIVAVFNGATLQNNGSVVVSSSDTNVVHVGGLSLFAKTAGSATISVTYGNYSVSPPPSITVVGR